MATLLAPPRLSTRGPATLTKPSHRLPSPPGTGSGIARAPPRWSCSAPAGRTWASPETSSSGGRGARRWPSGGSCLQPHALLCACCSPARPPRGWPDQAAPAARAAPDAAIPGARPVRRGGSDEPRKSAGAGSAARGCSRRGPPAAAARADTAQHPLAPQRPLGLLWPRSSRQRPGVSRGSLARTDPGDSPRPAEILPNMEPAGGGGREREAALARRETQLGRRGRNSGTGLLQGAEEKAAAHATRASLWSAWRMPGAVAESH